MSSLDEIRALLLGPEQKALTEIRDRLDNPAERLEEVSRILPQAIAQASGEGSNLAEALAPSVQSALKKSVARDPAVIADALFPIIGPAIRRAIADAFSKLLARLNQSLEHSFSLRGLRWQWEAWRSGRSFAEVVLARTLIFRVEHVFLIHGQTGLLLQHLVAANVETRDEDMISGMLTALQDFVRDSFGETPTDSFSTLEVGDLKIWIERGPHALIAAVVRGHAPHELRQQLQVTLEAIHREFADVLHAFDGNNAPFNATRGHLESCLIAQASAEGYFPSRRKLVVALLLIALPLIYLGVRRYQSHRRWSTLVDQLAKQDGLVLLRAEKSWGHYSLTGLRDSLAVDPDTLIAAAALPTNRMQSRWEPYVALSPDLVLRRAQHRLQPPPSTRLEFTNGTLTFLGEAPTPWIDHARLVAPTVPGIESVDFSRLLSPSSPLPRPSGETQMTLLLDRIETMHVAFQHETVLAPGEGEKLTEIAALIKDLAALGSPRWRIAVEGHANRTGDESLNQTLSRQRAATIVEQLTTLGIDPSDLVLTPKGSSEPLAPSVATPEDPRNRRVTFRRLRPETFPSPTLP